MLRSLSLALTGLCLVASTAEAKRAMRVFTPVERLAQSQMTVVGKVKSVEATPVMLPQYPGDPNKVAHKVAVIQVEKGLFGAGDAKEIKVAFLAPPKLDPNVPVRPGRGGFQTINLEAGQEGVFFLSKHNTGDYLTITPMISPLNSKDENYKAAFENVTKAAAALNDPAKALKAEKPEDRFLAAAAILARYRAVPDGVEAEIVKVPADESRLILKGLAEGDWTRFDENLPNATQAFYSLALTPKDGWVQPVIVNTPGAPPVDFNAVMKDAFMGWMDGAGKNYQINRMVPKKK